MLYQPLVQSSAQVTERGARPAIRSRHSPASTVGVESSNHEVGMGWSRRSEPVAARDAPSVPSNAAFTAIASTVNPASRRNPARVRSPRRGRCGRLNTCRATSGSSASASAMWMPSTVTGPSADTPSECAMPVASIATATAAVATAAPMSGRARRRPRRTTGTFQRTSSSTAKPAAPCAHVTIQARDSPTQSASTPVTKAASSAASRVRLVRRATNLR